MKYFFIILIALYMSGCTAQPLLPVKVEIKKTKPIDGKFIVSEVKEYPSENYMSLISYISSDTYKNSLEYMLNNKNLFLNSNDSILYEVKANFSVFSDGWRGLKLRVDYEVINKNNHQILFHKRIWTTEKSTYLTPHDVVLSNVLEKNLNYFYRELNSFFNKNGNTKKIILKSYQRIFKIFFSFQRSPLECIQKYKESKNYNMNSQARALGTILK